MLSGLKRWKVWMKNYVQNPKYTRNRLARGNTSREYHYNVLVYSIHMTLRHESDDGLEKIWENPQSNYNVNHEKKISVGQAI